MRDYQTQLETHPDGTGNLNAIVNGNWLSGIEWFNVASGFTASQTGTACTASGDVFTADDVGATIRYANGATAVITAFSSGTGVTVSLSQSISAQAFQLYRLDQILKTALARGLLKRTRFIAADDGQFISWDQTALKFVLNFGRNYKLGTLAYAASVALNFNSNCLQTVSLTGNITFTTSNRGAGKVKTVRIVADASIRSFTFPGWTFIGAAGPASIAASKSALLRLHCFGENDTDIVAEYSEQP